MTTLEDLQENVRVQPESAAAVASLAEAYASAGMYSEALGYFEKARIAEPDSSHRWSCCAEAFFQLGRYEEGIAAYERAAQLSPGSGYLCFRLAELLIQHDLLPEKAEQLLVQAIVRQPSAGDRDLALTRLAIRQFGPARALRHMEILVGAHIDTERLGEGVAEALATLGRYEEAREWYVRCLETQPEKARLLTLLAGTEAALGATDSALGLFERAVRLAPNEYSVAERFVYFFLRLGDLDSARRTFRSCLSTPGLDTSGVRAWRGEPVAGKTLLLGGQFGYGDAIQYGRFAQELHEAGATVVVECDRRLSRLVAAIDGIDRILLKRDIAGVIDYRVGDHLQALLFDWTWDSLGVSVPYLRVPPEEQTRWQLEQTQTLKVGLNWHGMPLFLNNPSSYRSLPLEMLAPLAGIPGVTLYSLQFGEGADQASAVSFPIVELPHRHDFLEAAAAVSALDVVVTIDSALAHIAGALGKPCLTLLPSRPCWRWMSGRPDTPWYPSMRLFRQSHPGSWTEPVREVCGVLSHFAHGRAALAQA